MAGSSIDAHPAASPATPSSSSYTHSIITAEETHPIRHAVLWPNVPLSDQAIQGDDVAVHFASFLSDPPKQISVITVYLSEPYLDPLPVPFSSIPVEHHARIRKFATLPEHQGIGSGSALIRYSMEWTRKEKGMQFFWLNARETAWDWYAKRGWIKVGEPFVGNGGKTYMAMGQLVA